MSDQDVEDALRECWQAEPPAAMRERVLARTRRDLDARPRPGPAPRAPRWQAALACAGLLLVVLIHRADNARQARLTEMVTGGRPAPSAAELCRMLDRQRAFDRLVAAGAVWEAQRWPRDTDGL